VFQADSRTVVAFGGNKAATAGCAAIHCIVVELVIGVHGVRTAPHSSTGNHY